MSNLEIAHEIFEKANQQAYLILNPKVGELEGETGCLKLSELMDELSIFSNTFLPAFRYSNGSECSLIQGSYK